MTDHRSNARNTKYIINKKWYKHHVFVGIMRDLLPVIHEQKPDGWTQNDLALLLNDPNWVGADAPYYTKLYNWLRSAVRDGLITSTGERGVYKLANGPTYLNEPVRVGMRNHILKAMRENGGYLRPRGWLQTQGLDDGTNIAAFYEVIEVDHDIHALMRTVDRVRDKSVGRSGNQTRELLYLSDELRARLPLPGRFINLDIRFALTGMPEERRPRLGDAIISFRDMFRDTIRRGLLTCRIMQSWLIVDMLEEAHALSVAFTKCLDGATDYWVADPSIEDRRYNDSQTVADLWRHKREELGHKPALAWFWGELEDPREYPELVHILTAEFWHAAGATFGVDAAMLSRGWVMRPTSDAPPIELSDGVLDDEDVADLDAAAGELETLQDA